MKYRTIKYGSWLMLAIVMLGFNSCEKYFEQTPVSLFSNENVFSNVDYTRQAIMGIYQLMTKDEGYSKRVSMYYTVDTDVAMCSGSLDNGRRGIARYAANSGNTEIEKPWRNFYMGIERANICIQQIPQSPIYSGGTPDQIKEMKRMYAEALTLRSLFYFELVRNWGDVPFKTTPSKAGDNFSLPKTDRDTIYKQIIGDLLEAKDLIGWKSEIDGYPERISKGAVLGLLARISLARGGYSLRRDGKMERRPDYLDYYKIARDYCDTIISSGQHGLHSDFGELFHMMCRYKLDKDVGESMWEVGLGKYDSGEVGYYLSNQESASSRYGRADGGMLILPSFYLSYDSLDTAAI
ncbi:MAG TPA: RagB/SusD family nutrient uptake outer membrane protein [Bacteroidales bacterium]|nr:RagB/SusD family nutrient uptake outer membrane protein [Bacteroidales bacterium]